MVTGIAAEFETIDLGDERLNQRSRSFLQTLSARPQASINAACDGWDETKAAYRLFDNPHIDPNEILAAHAGATRDRIEMESVVCVAQDTTERDFTSHPPDEIGCLNRQERRGFYETAQVAFTPEKLCLGVLDAEFFDRTPETLGRTQNDRPIQSRQRKASAGSKAIDSAVN